MRITFKRILHVLKHTETYVLIFFISFFMFTWPFIAEEENITQGKLFSYLLICWILIIFILFLISKSVGADKIEPTNIDDLK